MVLLLRPAPGARAPGVPAGARAARRPLQHHRGRAARPRQASTAVRAASFDLSLYHTAEIEELRPGKPLEHVVVLRLADGSRLPIHVGEHEGAALRAARAGRHPPRGGPWDLTLAALGAAGFGVACVRVVALVGNTYHARVHLRRTPGGGPESARARLPPGVAPDARDADIDARPSDAINLALRCGAPVYVLKELAAAMAAPGAPGAPGGARERGGGGAPGGAAGAALAAAAPEGSDARAITASCIEEIAAFDDPRVLVDLAMRVAAAEERFADAAALRDDAERMLTADRGCALVVAIETALLDARWEEAAQLRDELRAERARKRAAAAAAPGAKASPPPAAAS